MMLQAYHKNIYALIYKKSLCKIFSINQIIQQDLQQNTSTV